MRILLTGITGFVGKRFALHLSKSDEFFAVCRKVPADLPDGIKVIESDLNDEACFEQLRTIRPDVCIHLAWQGIPDYGFEVSFENLGQGAALFRCLVEECGCRKIVATGSCWEYGKMFGSCREDEPSMSNSYFTWAKRSLSDLGMMLAAKHGASFIWARFFYVYGPGQYSGSLIPTLTEALRNGKKPSVKTPHNANDFVYVDDIAQALMQMALKDIPTGIYNLGTGKSTAVWKVCEALEKTMGLKPVRAQELRASDVRATMDFWADTAKTEKMLAWRSETSVERGVGLYVKMLEEKQ